MLVFYTVYPGAGFGKQADAAAGAQAMDTSLAAENSEVLVTMKVPMWSPHFTNTQIGRAHV